MIDVRAHLAQKPLLFDGGMGTYYKAKPGTECEQANLLDPAGVLAVHREYLAAGAEAIKTNTFGLPRMATARQPDWQALARAGWKLAVEAAGETGAAVFADLGPAPDTEAAPAGSIYMAVARCFVEQGARNFLFETLSSDAGVLEAVQAIRARVPDAFVLVSFAVLPDGYTREGTALVCAGTTPPQLPAATASCKRGCTRPLACWTISSFWNLTSCAFCRTSAAPSLLCRTRCPSGSAHRRCSSSLPLCGYCTSSGVKKYWTFLFEDDTLNLSQNAFRRPAACTDE